MPIMEPEQTSTEDKTGATPEARILWFHAGGKVYRVSDLDASDWRKLVRVGMGRIPKISLRKAALDVMVGRGGNIPKKSLRQWASILGSSAPDLSATSYNGPVRVNTSLGGLSEEERAQMVKAEEIFVSIGRKLDVEEAMTKKLLQRYGL
jgi:hypothetical protein